eukprot:410271-Pelagomonas_calceolata.AAC.3
MEEMQGTQSRQGEPLAKPGSKIETLPQKSKEAVHVQQVQVARLEGLGGWCQRKGKEGCSALG